MEFFVLAIGLVVCVVLLAIAMDLFAHACCENLEEGDE